LNPQMEILPLTMCRNLPDGTGYTWTFTSLGGELLAQAEAQYGARNNSWTYIGPEICISTPVPRVWFPGGRRHVAIQLTPAVMNDFDEAVFQLAHEVVHLLEPAGLASAPVIEEGLATIFALDAVKARGINPLRYTDPQVRANCRYRHVEVLTRSFIEGRSGCIAALRGRRPSFRDWDAQFLLEYCPSFDLGLATELCQPMPR
jgi:hypothetical protein